MKSKYNIHRADEKFHIRIEKLNSGWMFTRITVNRSNFWHMFDEGISDPIIDLMKTYLAVRDCGEARIAIFGMIIRFSGTGQTILSFILR